MIGVAGKLVVESWSKSEFEERLEIAKNREKARLSIKSRLKEDSKRQAKPVTFRGMNRCTSIALEINSERKLRKVYYYLTNNKN